MDVPVVTPLLALFRADDPSYQPVHPAGLMLEDGNPQSSLENLHRLGLVIQDIWVRKGLSRVLFQFSTGEQYLALGLSAPLTLAKVAARAGFGESTELAEFYTDLPPTYDDKLPAMSEPISGRAHIGQSFRVQAATPAKTPLDPAAPRPRTP